MRKLRTLFTLLVVSMCAVQSAWAQEELSVTVSLRESGGLATEIRAVEGVEHEKYVVNLTVTSGELNDADWATLKLMDALKTLNLSGTSNKSIPGSQFNGCCANLESIIFPSHLKSIGASAFYGEKKLISAILPATVNSLGSKAFHNCSVLETITETANSWPAGVTTIPSECFDGCKKLLPFNLPEGVTSIGMLAFASCTLFKSEIPSTIQFIGSNAFSGCGMQDIDVVIPENTSIGISAFRNTNIKSIVFPTNFYYYKTNDITGVIDNCTNLQDVTLRTPAVFNDGNSGHLLTNGMNPIVHVPSFMVNAYLSDSYWYNYNIQGFDITTLDIWWQVFKPLELNAYTRMAGTPKVRLANNGNMIIKGDDSQQFGDFMLYGHTTGGGYSDNYHSYDWAQILSTCDHVTVTGNYYHKIQTYQKKWYFICLPFDLDISAITTDDGVKFAIRYYDGESRATNNSATGNWKDYASDAVIPAGTGFIYQTSQTTWTTFKAVENDSRNNAFKNQELTTTLEANATAGPSGELATANKGWNLVGNPWQCYYNIHKLNYNAPISVFKHKVNGGSTYEAYSIQDDDIALEPNQAFFIQCPDGRNSIGFPIDGRQLTSEITSVSAARQLSPAERGRWLVDVQIAYGEDLTDKTRLVVNNNAQMDYEIGSDASKFMSTDGLVPQIYSLDAEGTEYAINERPLDNGTLSLGVMIKEGGQYTISAIRNDIGQVLLTDHETGITTDLSQNGYCFNANAGTYEGRFTLSFLSGELTGIKTIDNSRLTNDNYYNLNGQLIDQPTKGVYVVGGKKVIMK